MNIEIKDINKLYIACRKSFKEYYADLMMTSDDKQFLMDALQCEVCANAIESIYQVLANGALGFKYLPSFDVDGFSATMGIRASIPNDSNSEMRSQKFVQILNEKLATAKQFVSKWEGLGRIIFPILKDKESLTSEEFSAIINDYRKEHPDEIRA